MQIFTKKRHPLELEAERVAMIIQRQLTRLNLAYRVKHSDGERVQQVQFVEPLIASPSEIKLEIDVMRLPRGVTITDLKKPEIVETLSAACKNPVRAEHKRGKGGGFWYIAELEERTTIPRLVRLSEMQRPAGAPPLALPIGVGDQRKQRWDDLRDLPHLLIAGATKSGKSVMVNAILCSLARRLGPDRLDLYLCDLKGGVELSFYEHLPHVRQFVTRAAELPAMLIHVQNEMDRRNDLMRGKARDIDGYNHRIGREHALPYVVIVIDEIANAMLSRDRLTLGEHRTTIKDATESALADLAARSRATGIHLVVSTQRPSVDVVTGLIKANFPCRIAFGTASEIDSRVIIDDGGAQGLRPGRMLYRRNIELIELQAPLLDDDEVRRHVAAIVAGEAAEEPPESEEDRARREISLLLDLAVHSFGGAFPIRELAAHPTVGAAQISRYRIEAYASRLEKEQILRRGWGPRPRTVQTATGDWKAKYPASVQRPASSQNRAHSDPDQCGDRDGELASIAATDDTSCAPALATIARSGDAGASLHPAVPPAWTQLL